MKAKNRQLFESLLYSAISQIETDSSVKQILIEQVFELITKNNNNNGFDVKSDFFSDKSLVEKYESITPFYEKCFDNCFNARVKTPERRNSEPPSAETALDVSPNIKRDFDLILEYAVNGRYDVAIPLCKHTLCKSAGQRTKGDEYQLSNTLGDMYFKRKQHLECESYLRRALDIRQQICGSNDKTCIEIKSKLSIALFEQKRYKESELLSKEVLSAIHHNECKDIQQSSVWELAEDLQENKEKDYSLVSKNKEHRNWYLIYDKYPMVCRLFAILIKLYRKNKKEIAAEVLSDVSAQLRQDLYATEDNVGHEIKYTVNGSVRRNTFPLIFTDSIACQTDHSSDNKVKVEQKSEPVVNKNSLFKTKILSALGKHYQINIKNNI